MSIGSAFNNAGSGLKATSRLAETISNNVANAMTPGFARRSNELTSLALGGYGAGVRVLGTLRAESAQVTLQRRLASAAAASASTLGQAQERLIQAIGQPGDARSLAARAIQFETALISAVATPSSSLKLGAAVDAAKFLAAGINAAAQEAAQLRTDAEAEIERQVATLNRSLGEIEELNAKIRTGIVQGIDVSGLEDERFRIVDRIGEIVPVRTVKREGGDIAIFSANGAILLDGRSWPVEFNRSGPFVTPDMTDQTLPPLRQLRGNDTWAEVPMDGPDALFAGGSLAALFEVRDKVAVLALRELDTLALDLIDRFEGPSLDGDGFGLFVNQGNGPDVGVAARLAVNAAVDPAKPGGELWRLRAGLDAGGPGEPGDATILQAMVDAYTEPRGLALTSTVTALGVSALAAEIGGYFSAQAARADETRAYLAGQQAVLAEAEAGVLGVDTDSELQFLMLVEQAYAANARVLSVLDSLLKQLLEI